MAEDNAKSLRSLHQAEVDNDRLANQSGFEIATRGQKYGLWTVLTFAGLTGLALFLGYPVVATAICTVTIGAVTTVFVTRQKRQNKTDNPSSSDAKEGS